MGLFSSKVPNTISDRKMADLKRRGAKTPWFTSKAVSQRKASALQRSKAGQS